MIWQRNSRQLCARSTIPAQTGTGSNPLRWGHRFNRYLAFRGRCHELWSSTMLGVPHPCDPWPASAAGGPLGRCSWDLHRDSQADGSAKDRISIQKSLGVLDLADHVTGCLKGSLDLCKDPLSPRHLPGLHSAPRSPCLPWQGPSPRPPPDWQRSANGSRGDGQSPDHRCSRPSEGLHPRPNQPGKWCLLCTHEKTQGIARRLAMLGLPRLDVGRDPMVRRSITSIGVALRK